MPNSNPPSIQIELSPENEHPSESLSKSDLDLLRETLIERGYKRTSDPISESNSYETWSKEPRESRGAHDLHDCLIRKNSFPRYDSNLTGCILKDKAHLFVFPILLCGEFQRESIRGNIYWYDLQFL